jgi:DNA-binding response OmpR family regulator
MSGYAEPVLTENGTLQDGVTLVEKPFTGRELLERVRHVLRRTTDEHLQPTAAVRPDRAADRRQA